MDATEQVAKFSEFFETQYYKELLDAASKGNKFLHIPFPELAKFHVALAEDLLEDPENTLQAAKHTVEQMDLGSDTKGFEIRFGDLPSTSHIMIRNIRSKHITKFVQLEGIVRQKSDVRPQVTSARFECPSCGNIIPVLQLDQKFKEPHACACGRKGQFRLLHKEMVDAQKIVLEEAPEDMEGGEQPKRLNIFLQNDLVSPISDKKTNPGSKIRLTGVIKEVPIVLATGGKSTRFDLICEANVVDPVQEEFTNIVFSDEEIEEIKEVAKRKDAFELIAKSLAPTIYGHDKVKEALLLQLFAGVQKTNDDGVKRRGDIHVLLIGDPGAGKSQLVKRMSIVAPKSRFVSGKGASGAGLTASVVKDEFLKGWALEAGTLVLANKGIACTTKDAEFILENGTKMSFEELFKNKKSDILRPKFKILGLDEKTRKIKPFSIKQAFRKPTDKKIIAVTLRTGRSLNLTQDNEVLILRDGALHWKRIDNVSRGEKIAVPRVLPIKSKDNFSETFSYVAGLIASDGHINIEGTKGRVEFYNSNISLVATYKEKVAILGEKTSEYVRKKGKISVIRNKSFVTRKDSFMIYTDKKTFAHQFVDFGIPSGDKSSKHALDNKIVSFSSKTIASFLKGIFDGDGSVRLDPVEVVLTSGMKENALLFQELLLRLGIISSVKKSTNSWHCEVRGTFYCKKFFEIIGSEHAEKVSRFMKIETKEMKDRIDIVPNSSGLFKEILADYRWKLGKNLYRYFWNYAKGAEPSKYRLTQLNKVIQDKRIDMLLSEDLLWDEVVSLKEMHDEYVYDFTMKGTNNFIANNIIMHNCIDEMDKMSDEDTSAMHEALEQQCYAYDTPLLFADGSKRLIGEYVEEQFALHENEVYEGHNCILLKDDVVVDELLTTNFHSIFPTKIKRVSKHKTTDFLYVISFNNGRSIKVTPEHPVFVVRNGSLQTIRADNLCKDDCVPIPRVLPIKGETQFFSTTKEEIFNSRSSQHIIVPEHNDAALYSLVGHLVAEGSTEKNRGKLIGVNFTNKDDRLLDDVRHCFLQVFGLKPYEQLRVDDHEPRMMLRYISRELAVFFEREFPELLVLAPHKSIPKSLIGGKKEDIAQLLLALFEGDGHVSVKKRTLRIGYASSSKVLVDQVQDLLLRFAIRSSITNHNNFYKVNITGYDNIQRFADSIGFLHPVRKEKVVRYLKDRADTKRTSKDILYGCGQQICDLLYSQNILRVGNTARSTMVHDYMKKGCGISRLQAKKLLFCLKSDALSVEEKSFVSLLEGFVFGDISFDKVKSITQEKAVHPWTYDVTIEPNHTFVSQAAILHNTVSISKANIQATLRCQTTVLAAANPKFGRFDPYELIAKQINLPEPLINRFDLIFPIKDLPDPARDDKMAAFILNLHRGVHEKKDESLLETEFIRKYIAYAKQHVYPELTDDALDEIKKYYVQMRNQGGEGSTSAVPISARQLEALVRLAEASAKSRLWPKVTKSDAQRAIDLVHYCLSQIGIDPETGKFDIDRITTGITAKQRSDISIVKEILSELEKVIGKIIPEGDIVREAEIKGVGEEKTMEILTKLTRQGDLFTPKNGFYSKVR